MEKKDLRIVYMGTPDFAVESLKCLVEGGYNVVGVITMPDKPMGRHGSVLQPSPVKQYAVSQGLRVLQPERLKDESFVEELRSLQADLQIVVAFRMLPEVVGICLAWERSIFMPLCCLSTEEQPPSIGQSSMEIQKRVSPPSS